MIYEYWVNIDCPECGAKNWFEIENPHSTNEYLPKGHICFACDEMWESDCYVAEDLTEDDYEGGVNMIETYLAD